MFGGDKARDFQRGMKAEDRRRDRENERLRLRKKDREERLQKRRQVMRRGGEAPQAANAGGAGFPHRSAGFPNMASDLHAHKFDHVAQQMLAQLPLLVRNCFQGDLALQFDATQRIRKLLSIERNPPIQQVIDSGVIPRLVMFLQDDEQEKLQFEAAWALTNIASGNAEHTAVVIRHGAIPLFVKLLASKSTEVVEQAVWALGNIAGDSPECRDLVLNHGGLDYLLPILANPRAAHGDPQAVSLVRNATWTLSNFCRGKPQGPWARIAPALPCLHQLLSSMDDEEVLQDACWAISYLSDIGDKSEDPQGDARVLELINGGLLKLVVGLLSHPATCVKHPCLRTIGNIVTGDDMQTQAVIDLGALPLLQQLLEVHVDKKGIKKEACWTISNITAGNETQIEAVISANLIHPLVHMLRHDEFDVQKEAAWALSNATSGGNPAQTRFLVNQGCIPPLCKLMECDNAKTVMVALEGVENMLKVGVDDRHLHDGENKMATFVEECGGLRNLEAVQAREDMPQDVFEKAAQMVRDYFEGAEDGDASEYHEPPPVADGDQFGFGHAPNASGGATFGEAQAGPFVF